MFPLKSRSSKDNIRLASELRGKVNEVRWQLRWIWWVAASAVSVPAAGRNIVAFIAGVRDRRQQGARDFKFPRLSTSWRFQYILAGHGPDCDQAAAPGR